ncbi:MAG: hydrogenase maturation nickel metallochaperone HypA [Acidimicrobiales bacterium]
MHELGLCQAIVDAVENRAGERPVARVRVRVGRLHHVHPGAFEQSFALAASGSVAEAATAELVMIPIRGRCRACAGAFETEEPVACCPVCGGLDIEQAGGDELVLESIEYRA